EFLLSSALDDLKISLNQKPLLPQQLLPSLRAASFFGKSLFQLRHKYHPEALRKLVSEGVTPEDFKNKTRLEELLKDLRKKLSEMDGEMTFTLEEDKEHNAYLAHVETLSQGLKRKFVIGQDLIESPEVEEIKKHFKAMRLAGEGPFRIDAGGQSLLAENRE